MTIRRCHYSYLNEQVRDIRLSSSFSRRRGFALLNSTQSALKSSPRKRPPYPEAQLLEEERMRLMKDFGNGSMTLQQLADATGKSIIPRFRSKKLQIPYASE